MLYELIDVSLKYGRQTALTLPSFSVAQGERIALLGPNGSGKTSLLKLMDGLESPTEGTILLAGKPLSKHRSSRPRSVYLHQYPYLLRGSVAYNIAFGCMSLSLSREETSSRLRKVTEVLGLAGMEGKSHRALSGGEAQRVALARALATEAEVLLLDEPTASADAASVVLIEAAIRRASQSGKTIVFSTHDEEFAARLGSREVRLHAGKMQ